MRKIGVFKSLPCHTDATEIDARNRTRNHFTDGDLSGRPASRVGNISDYPIALHRAARVQLDTYLK